MTEEQRQHRKAYQAKYRAAHRERLRELNKRWREANKEKLASYFHDYYIKNHARKAAWQKVHNKKIKVRLRAYERKRCKLPHRIEKQRACNAAWRAANREKANAIGNKWWREHKAKRSAKDNRKRATRLKATPIWANPTKIAEFYETADGLGMLTGEWYHVDHIVPLRSNMVCGLHCEQNLHVITDLENRKKSNVSWPHMP